MGGLISAVERKTFAFDSAPLIDYLEEHPKYFPVANQLFDSVRQRLALGITSILTLTEVLIVPFRRGKAELAENYRGLLMRTRGIALFPIDRAISERAARLRADHLWLRTPDALQLATALECGADLSVTNDPRWKQLSEIPAVVLSEYLESQP